MQNGHRLARAEKDDDLDDLGTKLDRGFVGSQLSTKLDMVAMQALDERVLALEK